MGVKKVKNKNQTREQWLERAIEELKVGLFKRHEYKIPKVRVSVGFALGSRKAIGQHWHPKTSDDKKGQILISPVLGEEDALGTLVHELIHAAVGNEAGHGPEFRRCAIAVGLVGKMRSTVAGAELKKELKKLVKDRLGKYPHSKLNPNNTPRKKQGTRMIKMQCAFCGYIARTSMRNLDEHGPVICPNEKVRMDVVS